MKTITKIIGLGGVAAAGIGAVAAIRAIRAKRAEEQLDFSDIDDEPVVVAEEVIVVTDAPFDEMEDVPGGGFSPQSS